MLLSPWLFCRIDIDNMYSMTFWYSSSRKYMQNLVHDENVINTAKTYVKIVHISIKMEFDVLCIEGSVTNRSNLWLGVILSNLDFRLLNMVSSFTFIQIRIVFSQLLQRPHKKWKKIFWSNELFSELFFIIQFVINWDHFTLIFPQRLYLSDLRAANSMVSGS